MASTIFSVKVIKISKVSIDRSIEAFSSPPSLSLFALQSLIEFGAQQEEHMGFIEVVSQLAKPALDVHGQCFHVHMQWSLAHLGTGSRYPNHLLHH
ncbi:unnamed protein product [Musa acuminata subsp. malaccensis]|uniref:(wild Malaysian banana) hypothetical protein n=1 Tax=Musa acuminata subsp. malaccensis TaxID=214687 RepID=A0A804KMU6_MUSAM|nr:unnamed protein product [Musa acuminata subsp. malaccensis]